MKRKEKKKKEKENTTTPGYFRFSVPVCNFSPL